MQGPLMFSALWCTSREKNDNELRSITKTTEKTYAQIENSLKVDEALAKYKHIEICSLEMATVLKRF